MAVSGALARLNLNVPPEAREMLRSLAKARGQPDAVYARELLVDALKRAKAEEIRLWIKSRSPELRARERQIVEALEPLQARPSRG